MKTLVILEIELERPIPDLAALIANRASTFSNVIGVSVMELRAVEEVKRQQPQPRNEGHGHVVPRPDGAKARCGGPAMCATCQRESRIATIGA